VKHTVVGRERWKGKLLGFEREMKLREKATKLVSEIRPTIFILVLF